MKRLIYWRGQREQAFRALENGEWWNGRVWRPAGTQPRSGREAAAYRSAHDRLSEIVEAMVGGDEATRVLKAGRFGQSAKALRKRDPRKDDSQDAWLTLVAKLGEGRLLKGPLTLELLCDCAEELRRGRHMTRYGRPWSLEGVKSLLRRRQRL